jgi:predicted O-methyltransferase YrrM
VKTLERLLLRRPRILNQLHRLHLAGPASQTNEEELSALSRHATGKRRALEIGTHQGVSAARIAKALASDGALYCVDPWPAADGRLNPCWLICERHLRRSNVWDRIKILRAYSANTEPQLLPDFDFVFIDGDHSWSGIETDWRIVARRLAQGAVICLHDVVVPAEEPWRHFGSVEFYNDVISKDDNFDTIETVYSMAVLRKK